MRRVAFAILLAATVVGVSVVVAAQGGDDGGSGGGDVRTASERSEGSTSTTSSTTTTTTLPTPNSDGPLHLVRTVTGDISPKSVVASGRGQVFAQIFVVGAMRIPLAVLEARGGDKSGTSLYQPARHQRALPKAMAAVRVFGLFRLPGKVESFFYRWRKNHF